MHAANKAFSMKHEDNTGKPSGADQGVSAVDARWIDLSDQDLADIVQDARENRMSPDEIALATQRILKRKNHGGGVE